MAPLPPLLIIVGGVLGILEASKKKLKIIKN